MTKLATTVDRQIAMLRERGMDVGDETKAEEYLLDIGYYRLGFYWFPFEETYPQTTKRTHRFKPTTQLDYAVRLYYFDVDLRNILLRYISRIEVNFRTTLVYNVSNAFLSDPYWYKNPGVVNESMLQSADYLQTLQTLSRQPVIRQHARAHPDEPQPPAWKALEFMSFGTIIAIYDNLKHPGLQCAIAKRYSCSRPHQFYNYINTVRKLRNYCAHGRVLFDLHLDQAIGKGPLGDLMDRKTTLGGMCDVTCFLLHQISQNRAKEMMTELKTAYDRVAIPVVKQVIVDGCRFVFGD